MGSVRQLPSGSWQLRYSAGGQRQTETVKATSRRDAEKHLRKIEREVEAGEHAAPTKITVAEYLDDWLAKTRAERVPKTNERYAELAALQLKPHLGSIRLDQLTPLKIVDFQRQMLDHGRVDGKGGLSAQTVLHLHRLLARALAQAVEWEILAKNPCDRVPEPQVDRPDIYPLTVDECVRLLEAAVGTGLYLPILIASATGCRRGEILAIQWRDIDFGRATITVRHSVEQITGHIGLKKTKNKKIRVLGIPTYLVEALRQHKGEQAAHRLQTAGYQDQGLVLARKDGTPLRPDRFSCAFGEFIVKHNLPAVRFHDLRHTHISQLLGAGMGINTVQRRAGHSQASTTLDIYGHVMAGADQEAARQMDATIGAALNRRAAGD